MARTIVAAEIGYLDTTVSPSSPQTLYVASEGFVTLHTDTLLDTYFAGRLDGEVGYSLKLSTAFWGGNSSIGIGALEVINSDGEYDEWLEWDFRDQSVVVKLHTAGASYDTATVLLNAIVERLDVVNEQKLRFVIRDPAAELITPMTTDSFDDTTDAEGVLKPIPFGQPQLVKPVLISEADLEYHVSDTTLQSIDTVYDQGISVDFTPVANGFQLVANPSGKITATITTAISGGADPVLTPSPTQYVLSGEGRSITMRDGGLESPETSLRYGFSDIDYPRLSSDGGLWYFEMYIDEIDTPAQPSEAQQQFGSDPGEVAVGIAAAAIVNPQSPNDTDFYCMAIGQYAAGGGTFIERNMYGNGSNLDTYAASGGTGSPAQGDTIGVKVDFSSSPMTIEFLYNNVNNDAVYGPWGITAGTYSPVLGAIRESGVADQTCSIRLIEDDFVYAIPSGYTAWAPGVTPDASFSALTTSITNRLTSVTFDATSVATINALSRSSPAVSAPVLESWQVTAYTDSPAGGDNEAVLELPTGVTAGDMLVVIMCTDHENDMPLFLSSGFTKVGEMNNTSADAAVGVLWKIADGTETDITVTWTGNWNWVGYVLRVSGAAAIDASLFGWSGNTVNPKIIGEITTTVDNTLAFYAASFDGTDTLPVSVSGGTNTWVEIDEQEGYAGLIGNAGGVAATWGYQTMATAGVTGDATVTGAVGDGASYVQFAISPSPATTPYSYAYYLDKSTTGAQVLNWWASSVGGAWWVNRLGKVQVAQLTAPATSAKTIDDNQIVGDISIAPDYARDLSNGIGALRNWSPYRDSEVAGSATEVWKQQITRDYQYEYRSANTLSTGYTHADGGELPMNLLIDSTAASTEADRLTALYGKEQYFYRVPIALNSVDFDEVIDDIGQTYTIDSDRFGLSGGIDLILIGVDGKFLSNELTLTLWSNTEPTVEAPPYVSPYPVIEEIATSMLNPATGSITCTAPSGITAGELLLLVVTTDEVGSVNRFGTVPSGWTNLGYAYGTIADSQLAIFWKEAVGTETNTAVSWTYSTSTGATAYFIRISGANTTVPFDASNFEEHATIVSDFPIPAITTTTDNCLAMYGLSFDGSDGYTFSVAGSGWSEAAELSSKLVPDANGSSSCIGTKEMPVAGSTGIATVTASVVDTAVYFQLAIKPD